jgi:NAD(P)-dependent dehydrogenase (short-subunit alcohol dehydrogenase family)
MSRLTLVTGASRGIGRAIALEAARRSHDLVLVSRQAEAELAEVRREAEAGGSARVLCFCGDMTDPVAVENLFAKIPVEPNPLSGLVNCAGFVGDRRTLAESSIEMIDRILAVNIRATLLCCRAAIGQMSRAAGGSGGAIVNLSSQSATFGGDRLSVYSASKAAINGLTVSLAREVAPIGIRVNAVSPGPVLTEPVRALGEDKLRSMQMNLPMGRFCEPEEVARTVLWLLSEEASYESGAIVSVHGAR